MTKKNVRIFATWRKDLCNINKVRDNHFRYLSQNFDLTLLMPSDSEVGEHIDKEAIHFVPIPKIPMVKLFYFYLYAWIYFLRNCRQRPYHLIWAVIGEEPIGWLLRFCCSSKTKLVFDLWDIPGSHILHASKIKNLLYWFYEIVLKTIIKTGDIVICGVMAEGLRKFCIPAQAVIFSDNGVLTDIFVPDAPMGQNSFWDDLTGSLNLLYHGYLHKSRGSEDAIQLIDLLNKIDLKVNLLLVGPSDPITRENLEQSIEAYQLGDQVKILDNIDSETIPALISSADICICPLSDIEKFRWSMPVKIYEYLAIGKPVVASDLPGIAHIIEHMYNGLLFPPNDMEALSTCIENLATDGRLYKKISQNARKSVLTHHWDLLLDHLTDNLFQKLDSKIDVTR